MLINAETDDDGLLGDLLEEDDEEATRARVCLDQAFEDVRSGNRAANDTDDNDDGLLGGLFGDDTDDNDDGLLGGLFGDDTDDNDDGLLGGL